MRVTEHNIPAPILVLDEVFDTSEMRDIFAEAERFRIFDLLQPPDKTATALDENDQPKKQNSGIFLDEYYEDRSASAILALNRKLIGDPAVHQAVGDHASWYFNNLFRVTNLDHTLLSYYEDGGHYKPHRDNALFTIVFWFYREPKRFRGGRFFFPDYDFEVPIASNRAVIFPSPLLHEVSAVTIDPQHRGKGLGRYAMSIFVLNK